MTGRAHFSWPRLMLVAFAAVIAAEGWGVAHFAVAFRSARKERDAAAVELASLTRGSATLLNESVGLIDAVLAETQQRRAALAARLLEAGRDESDDKDELPAAEASDVFFELNRVITRLRDRADVCGVALANGESFGFAAFLRELPARMPASVVLRELRVMEFCLEGLFECRPGQLMEVSRIEKRRPAAPAKSAKRPRTGTTGVGAETRTTAGPSEGGVFRVTFTGETDVLRRWLNRLAEEPGPARVTFVEASEAERPEKSGDGEEAWIRGRPLRFVVVIEMSRPVSVRAG